MGWIFQMRIVSGILAAAAIFAGAAFADEGKRNAVCIQGSHTVANLIGPWASEFGKEKDGFTVVVYGSTQGKGLQALFKKQADVAMFGQYLSPEEKAEAAQNGFALEEVSLGVDAIPIVVHPSNPVSELTLDHLRGIFSGQYTSWKDVGGPDHPIEVIALPADTGFSQYICKDVLKTNFGPNTQFVSAIPLAPKVVQARTWAISFCRHDLGLKEHQNNTLKMLKLKKDNSSAAVTPLQENTYTENYPIVRPLLLAYDSRKLDDSAKRFVEFCQKKAKAGGPVAHLQNEK